MKNRWKTDEKPMKNWRGAGLVWSGLVWSGLVCLGQLSPVWTVKPICDGWTAVITVWRSAKSTYGANNHCQVPGQLQRLAKIVKAICKVKSHQNFMNNQWHIQYLVSTWVSISWSSSDLISIFSTLGFLTFLNTRQPQIQYSFSSWSTCNTVIPFQPCLSHKRLGERLRGVWGGGWSVYWGWHLERLLRGHCCEEGH